MPKTNQTITKSWPAIKEDLLGFLSDTDAWIIDELKKAYSEKNWNAIASIIEIMDAVHNLSHSH